MMTDKEIDRGVKVFAAILIAVCALFAFAGIKLVALCIKVDRIERRLEP